MQKERPRFTRTRIYLCLSVLLSVLIGVADDNSQHHYSINTTTLEGSSAFGLLLVAALLGLIDTIGHDLMGFRQCFFRNLCKLRFMWLIALAMSLVSLILQGTFYNDPNWSMARYALDAIFALSIAGSDLWDKFTKWTQES